MTATNHALTGALIGMTVHNPWVAFPAAFASHFVCDMIPHFGPGKFWLASRSFRYYLLIDALLCVLVVTILFRSDAPGWLQAALCAFVATTPDLLWLRQFLSASKGKRFRETALEALLVRIQWFEKPSGAFVELAWGVGCVVLLSALI